MNDRIKELIEKSYYECPQVTSYMWENHIVPPEQWIKFAELIIRECADIAKHNVMNISTYSDAEFVEEQIKQHFGDEE